jgi:acetyl esterase/lipase
MKTVQTHRLLVFVFCCVSYGSIAGIANAEEEQASKTMMLWPQDASSKATESQGMGTPKHDRGDGHVRLTDVTTPSLRYFPAPSKGKPAPAVILCPGGGYVTLVTTKMIPIAEWLNDHGISAFVLIYRVPKKRQAAFQDIQRAVRIVRSRASEWNLDPSRIGVMGSSAGGHLAARVSTGFDIQTYQQVDKLDDVSCKPNFTVLLYPAYMNRGKALSKEFVVSNTLSPTLIVSARDDKGFFAGSQIYAEALKEAGASVRVHFFEKGGHGFSLRPKEYPLSTWPDLCLQWLRDKDIIEQAAQESGRDKQ